MPLIHSAGEILIKNTFVLSSIINGNQTTAIQPCYVLLERIGDISSETIQKLVKSESNEEYEYGYDDNDDSMVTMIPIDSSPNQTFDDVKPDIELLNMKLENCRTSTPPAKHRWARAAKSAKRVQ